MKPSLTRSLTLALAMAVTSLIVGCATTRSVPSEVSSMGEWPAGRPAGTFAFDRLPSQQARAAEMDEAEGAARGALHKAGFVAVAPGAQPDVLVQVGTRNGRSSQGPWSDSVWWRGSYGYYRGGPWLWGPHWGMGGYYDTLRYDREVALLIRDRASGKPLFEARASNEGSSPNASTATLAAMFEAAMFDFPRLGINPRRVVVDLPG